MFFLLSFWLSFRDSRQKRLSRPKVVLVLLLLLRTLSNTASAPSALSPLSRSHSGEEAPLHSLRGPRMGDIRLKSDKETVLGRSRLQGREERVGEVEVGEPEADEEEEKGQGKSRGLFGPELMLLLD